MANDYRIIKNNKDEEMVVILSRIHIGELIDETTIGKIVLKTHINSMKDITVNKVASLLSRYRDSETPLDKLIELLNQYADLKILSDAGIEHLPITRKADGSLNGFAEGMEEEKVEG